MVVDKHSTSMCQAVGLSGPKMSAATISKGVPIGRLSQRHGFENCVLAIQKVHRVRNAQTLARCRGHQYHNASHANVLANPKLSLVIAEAMRMYNSLPEVRG